MTKPLKVTAAEARRLQRNLKGNEDMTTQQELMDNVKAKLPSRQAITTYYIQQRYHCLQSQAHKCITDLQTEGLIGTEWDPQLGGYVVVKEQV